MICHVATQTFIIHKRKSNHKGETSMKKLIIALMCAFTLFAFASCENGTPAPDQPTKPEIKIHDSFWGTYKFSDGSGNAIKITETTFEIGNILNGEFTATTHVEELYADMPYGVTEWGELTGCNFDQEANYVVRIELDRNTAYALRFEGGEGLNPVYRSYSALPGETAKWESHPVEKI